jgi:hypothetical protein
VLAPEKRLVTGEDLMQALGIDPGPEVGRLLRAIDEALGAGDIATRDEALSLAQHLHAEGVRS